MAPRQKKSLGCPTYPESHGILVILHYGKYKGAIMVKEKELIRVAAPSHVVLELRTNFQFAFGCSGGDHSLGLYIVRSGLGFILYCIGSTSVSLPSLSPQLRRHHPRASRARQQRLHIRIRYASFALANCRIGHLGTLRDLHTHSKILTFCRFTFFPVACIALRQNPRSSFTRHGPVSPETAVAIHGAKSVPGCQPLNPRSFHKIPH